MSSSDPTIVFCIACNESIYELVNPISTGSTCNSSDFVSLEPEKYENPQDGQLMTCPKCGDLFITQKNGVFLKTNKGMLP